VLASTLPAGVAPAAEPGDAASQAAPIKAKWVTRKLHYIYQGFTAHYSCDGLQEEITGILKKLGARNDLKVRRIGCTRLEGPEPFPGVDATFEVLVPADSVDQASAGQRTGQGGAGQRGGGQRGGGQRGGGQRGGGQGGQGGASQGDAHQGAADSQVVMARWQNVTLQGSTPLRSNAPGCELVEQAKKTFLPLFTTRDVKFSSDCFPHSASIASTRLSADVLLPVKPPVAKPSSGTP